MVAWPSMADLETIRYGVHDGVATIELARPDKRNAINAQMFTELGDAAERAAGDPGIRAVLVRAQGPVFCSGIDVTLLGQMNKPSVAAIQGPAVGAGFQLALACDLRVASEDARFAMLEVRFGLVPDLGGSHRLARQIGPARAKELIWTGRAVEADEAERIGLVNRVVAAGALDKEADVLVRE